MAPTHRPYFSRTRRPPWNPLAEFVHTTLSMVGRLGLGPQPSARLSPAALVLSNRGLDLGHAAINEQLDPRDVAAVVGREEHGGFRHLVRPAHPAHRHGGYETHLELIDSLLRQAGLVEDGRFGVSGTDNVDADLAVLEIGGPAARERPHGRLAGAVDAER